MVAAAVGGWVLLANVGDRLGAPRNAVAPMPEGDPSPAPEPKIERRWLQVPDDAIREALTDLQTIPPYAYPYQRWVWIPDGDVLSVKTTSLVLNYVGRKSDPYLPPVVAGQHLVRVDLRVFWPRERDLDDVLGIWEEFGFDPSFALLVTKDTLHFAEQFGLPIPKVKVTRTVKEPGWRTVKDAELSFRGPGRFIYPDDSGRTLENVKPGNYSWKEDLRFKTETVRQVIEEVPAVLGSANVVRFNALAINQQAFLTLQEVTRSVAPIVEHSYFKFRAMRQIQDDGLFKDIWGGLNYRLTGVRKSNDPKVTDQALFLQDFLGIGNIKGGLNAKQLFDSIRSDHRYAILRSEVTGKPRIAVVIPTLAGKYNESKGMFTLDIKDKKVDFGDRGYQNLLNPRFDAQEGIFQRANGLTYNILFNGDGALQDEVPPDVANDTTIPGAHTKRLQPTASCFNCHQMDGSDYWKPLKNDVLTIWGQRRPVLDTFGDLGAGKRAFDYDTIDRLAGLYAGNPIDGQKVIRRAREDVAQGTLACAGPWDGDLLGKDVCKKAANRRFAEETAYWYSLIGAREALMTLGLDEPPDNAVETFKRVLPPDLRELVGGVYYSESPTIGAIREGLGVPRSDWELLRSYVAERSRPIIDQMRKEKTK